MYGQMNLTLPYQPYRHTSKAAAEAVRETAETQRARVWDAVIRCGESGATDEEIQRITNLPGNAQRPRRVELVNLGRVLDSGTTRATQSGRQAIVWIASEFR